MVKVDEYPEKVQEYIEEYASLRSPSEHIESQLVFDTKNHHYQLVNVGWIDNKRVYGCVLHFDVKGDKVWIQRNGTEIDVAEALVERGIPKESIVIGLHAPYKRPFTKYAIN